MRGVPRESKAIEEAFAVGRAVAPTRGLKSFAIEDAVLVFTSPTGPALDLPGCSGKDLGEAKVRQRHVRLVTAQLLQLTGSGE